MDRPINLKIGPPDADIRRPFSFDVTAGWQSHIGINYKYIQILHRREVDKTSVNCELVILRGLTEIKRNGSNGFFGRGDAQVVHSAETGVGLCGVCGWSWAKLMPGTVVLWS